MNIALDVLTAAILAVSVVSGFRRGFIRTVTGLLVLVLAVLAAKNFSGGLALRLEEKYVGPAIRNALVDEVKTYTGEDASAGDDGVDMEPLVEDRPEFFLTLVDKFGATYNEVYAAAKSAAEEGKAAVTEIVLDTIAKPAAARISEALAYVIVFVAAAAILSLAAHLLDLVFKLPVLGAINRVLGIAAGAAIGVVGVMVLCLVFDLAVPLLKISESLGSGEEIAETTALFRYFYQFRLFNFIK